MPRTGAAGMKEDKMPKTYFPAPDSQEALNKGKHNCSPSSSRTPLGTSALLGSFTTSEMVMELRERWWI